MVPSQPAAGIFVPDGSAIAEALARTTHLGIGAHPDDLELMTWHGIFECLGSEERWFTGAVVTDGAGSPPGADRAQPSDPELCRVRLAEQRKAAVIGEYAALATLGFASAAVRGPCPALQADLTALLEATRPQVVFTHNPADKHDTHVAVALQVVETLRRLEPGLRPRAVYGCEVWRGLDWLQDGDKRVFDVGGHEGLGSALTGVFTSQISGGKRYDLAALGRRRANATWLRPHRPDEAALAEYAMDLTPLVEDPGLEVRGYVLALISRFSDDVAARLDAFSPT